MGFVYGLVTLRTEFWIGWFPSFFRMGNELNFLSGIESDGGDDAYTT